MSYFWLFLGVGSSESADVECNSEWLEFQRVTATTRHTTHQTSGGAQDEAQVRIKTGSSWESL